MAAALVVAGRPYYKNFHFAALTPLALVRSKISERLDNSCSFFSQMELFLSHYHNPVTAWQFNYKKITNCLVPSVLWHCWLGGKKGIRPVKNEWWGVGMVVCLEQGADLHMAQLMPLPLTVSCFRKIQIGFAFLVLADLGSPGKGPLNGCCCCVM